jgi:16S rRNA (adenine1518-N6/adenine1519-N6)-dimethyltransferase
MIHWLRIIKSHILYYIMHHRAKKQFGQNFLTSKKALQTMIHAGDVTNVDCILEIGPGKGALTKELVSHAKTVVAVEKDHDLLPLLQELFEKEIQEKKLILIESDILSCAVQTLIPKNQNYKLIANIPYNITGTLIRKFTDEEPTPTHMVLLVQKEVADRIVAKDGKQSILSIAVALFGTAKKHTTVHARFFKPAPKVDSAIISIIRHDTYTTQTRIGIMHMVKTGFGQKRKTLVNNLSQSYDKKIISAFLENNNLSLSTRPEDMSLDHWVTLYHFIQKNMMFF